MAERDREQMQLFLNRLLLRSVLTQAEQEAVLSLPGFEQHIPASVDFVRMGEHVDHSCLIVTGLAARYGQTAAGERQITMLHIPGDMADLHSVAVPNTALPLQAIHEVTIRKVPHKALKKVADRFPALARAFWRDGMADLHLTTQTLVSLGRRRADGRLANLFCELALRLERIGQGGRGGFELPATQQQLGDMLGLTSVHVNRTLRALREEGMAAMRGSRVEILDWERLVALAAFDPAYLQLDRVDLHS